MSSEGPKNSIEIYNETQVITQRYEAIRTMKFIITLFTVSITRRTLTMKEYLIAEIERFTSSPINQVMFYLGATTIGGGIFLKAVLIIFDKATDVAYSVKEYFQRKHIHNRQH